MQFTLDHYQSAIEHVLNHVFIVQIEIPTPDENSPNSGTQIKTGTIVTAQKVICTDDGLFVHVRFPHGSTKKTFSCENCDSGLPCDDDECWNLSAIFNLEMLATHCDVYTTLLDLNGGAKPH